MNDIPGNASIFTARIRRLREGNIPPGPVPTGQGIPPSLGQDQGVVTQEDRSVIQVVSHIFLETKLTV